MRGLKEGGKVNNLRAEVATARHDAGSSLQPSGPVNTSGSVHTAKSPKEKPPSSGVPIEDVDQVSSEVAYLEGIQRLRACDWAGATCFLEVVWYASIGRDDPPEGFPDSFQRRRTEEFAATDGADDEYDMLGLDDEEDGAASEGSHEHAEERKKRGKSGKVQADEKSGRLDKAVEMRELLRRASEVSVLSTDGSNTADDVRGVHSMIPVPERRDIRKDRLNLELDLKLPLLMCLAYTKLEEWTKIHILVRHVLEGFPSNASGLPNFHREKDTDRWCRLVIFQGVACAFLGVQSEDMFRRARGCFMLAQRAQPKNRVASRGLQCVKFLQQQLGCSMAADFESRSASCCSALSSLRSAVTPESVDEDASS